MTQMIVPQMFRGAFRPLQEAIERKPSATISRDALGEFLDACFFGSLQIDEFRQVVDRIIQRGVEGRQFRALLTDCINALNECLDTFQRAKEWITSASIPLDEMEIHIQFIEDAVSRADDLKNAYDLWLVRLKKPAPKIDLASLKAPGDNFLEYDAALDKLRAD